MHPTRHPAHLILLAVLAAASTAQAGEEFLSFTGKAVDAETGTHLYTENYFLRLVDGGLRERIVVYTCPDAAADAFARKTVDVVDRFKPSFELVDQRSGYVEGFDPANRKVKFRAGPNAELQEAVVEDSDTLVVDSGFDEFVLKHWDTLLGGDKMAIDFVVPSQQEALGFKIRHLESGTVVGRPAETFRLALTGLLGLIADGIDVSYDRENRQLLRFAGLSNLRDAEGDNYTVRIDFLPADRKSLPDGSALTEARTRALDGRCP